MHILNIIYFWSFISVYKTYTEGDNNYFGLISVNDAWETYYTRAIWDVCVNWSSNGIIYNYSIANIYCQSTSTFLILWVFIFFVMNITYSPCSHTLDKSQCFCTYENRENIQNFFTVFSLKKILKIFWIFHCFTQNLQNIVKCSKYFY